MKAIVHYLRDLWHVITIKTPVYEFLLVDMELYERGEGQGVAFYYRTIGARTVERITVDELNASDAFAKFPPSQAQMIVTIATIEAILRQGMENLESKYNGYIEQCVQQLKKK